MGTKIRCEMQFKNMMDTEMMTVQQLQKEDEYSKLFYLLSHGLIEAIFNYLFNLKLTKFLNLVYSRKRKYQNSNKNQDKKLFDLDQLMEFKTIKTVMEFDRIHPLFKKIEEAFLKGQYNSFGKSKVGKVSQKVDSLVRMGYIDPEAYQRKLETGRDVILNKKKKSTIQIFKNVKIRQNDKFSFDNLTVGEVRVILLTTLNFVKEKPHIVSHYDS